MPLPITVVVNPTATTTSSISSGLLCVGSSMQLTASPSDKTFTYQWLRDSVPIPNASLALYEVKQTGKYTVQITDPNGCMGESKLFEVKPFHQASIILQTIPTRCSNDTTSILLVGTPTGGTFMGICYPLFH
jgi:predicted ATP-grasp superfamily ATP-dependent carboligase